MNDLAKLLSLGMTPGLLIFTGCVVFLWGPKARKAIKDEKPLMEVGWLIVGVTLGHIARFSDNTYWAFPWQASFLDHESADALFDAGVYSNIIFRQGLGMVASWCHIRSVKRMLGGWYRVIMWSAVAAGLAYVVILLLLRGS